MIWSYRAIKNPIARKKWLLIIFTIVFVFFGYGAYRIISGENLLRISLLLAIFSFFIFLYSLITLGRPRYYFFYEDQIIYKPFKTKIGDVVDFKVDEKNLLIKLNKRGIFGVKTLYFEKLEDLKEAERWLKRKLKRF
ncbi:MAG: hypothetical protein N3D09_03870 [Archaeoglobaceae archaeon]|nr:hypothetical protein [Archaeoglobaceae archaeon]